MNQTDDNETSELFAAANDMIVTKIQVRTWIWDFKKGRRIYDL